MSNLPILPMPKVMRPALGLKCRRKGHLGGYRGEIVKVDMRILGRVYYMIRMGNWCGRVSEKTINKDWEIQP